MTCVEKREIFFVEGGGCLQFGRGELGWGRRRRNKEGDSWQSGDILTCTDGIIDGLILSVISSVILTVNWSHHCMKILV
jgi:hypothetical protein